MAALRSSSLLGKYREIVLAVAFFLVFDLAVLLLNFYTSYQISADAVAINIAGRQRMLSQRMTKALFDLTSAHDLSANAPALKELREAAALFSATLNAFRDGGEVKGGDERMVRLEAVTAPAARDVLGRAEALWQPYARAIAPMLAEIPDFSRLDAALASARANNLKLLAEMNRFTSQLEHTAEAKADRLRMVQTFGILLALLNFALILVKFVRKLRESDRKIEQAQQETTEILATVRDGLFLLDRDGRLGSQASTSLPRILRREVPAGTDFLALLQGMVSAETFETARDYIELIFGDRVMESLVGALNPLAEVQVRGEQGEEHYLSFSFNRVREQGRTVHLLVTVSDVSERVRLGRALEEARSQGQIELDILLRLLKVDAPTLERFLQSTRRALQDINQHLRNVPDAPAGQRKLMQAIFRAMHAIKGDAAMLGLSPFESQAHDFETALAALRDSGRAGGEDLLGLAVRLEAFFEHLGMVEDIVARLANYRPDAAAAPEDDFAARLAALARRIAADHAKEVEVELDLGALDGLPGETRLLLHDIAIQLVRNAVAHGIEPPGERARLAKPAAGQIRIACERKGADWEFVLRDDGRGLSPDALRAALRASGACSDEELARLSDRAVVMKIFEPGVSTARAADRDAGRGVGMDLVKEKLRSLGGQLRIASRPRAYTEFRIRFAA